MTADNDQMRENIERTADQRAAAQREFAVGDEVTVPWLPNTSGFYCGDAVVIWCRRSFTGDYYIVRVKFTNGNEITLTADRVEYRT